MSVKNFNFIIIDDHKMISAGLSAFLTANFPGSACLASFENAESCLDYLDKDKNSKHNIGTGRSIDESPASAELPILAIVDLNLAGAYSFPLIKELAGRKIKVLVYTMFESSAFAMRSVECGAMAYILKGGNESDLLSGVQNTLDGKTFISRSLEKNFAEIMHVMSLFSPKEKRVAEFLMEGKNNSEIASAMNISKRSVENYLSHMYDKAGVLTRDELKARLD